jgi:hypothetical protein
MLAKQNGRLQSLKIKKAAPARKTAALELQDLDEVLVTAS